MLKKIGNIPALRSQFASPWSLRLITIGTISKLSLLGQKCDLCSARHFNTCVTLNRDFRKSYERARDMKERATEREESVPVSLTSKRISDIFPDKDLPNRLFNGIMFKEIPIVNVKVTPNNTIINLTDSKGIAKLISSCGMEGFKNAKKGTNLAAQATALTFARKAVDMGYRSVRLRIQGLGPGRISSVKGLTMGGLDVISVTDNTHVSDNPPRGKKLRRI